MKLSSYAVDQVYSLLSTITQKKYKDCKPTAATDSEYLVVNSLPVNAGVFQKCYVNVNCHAKDMKPGIPNRAKLDSMATSVLSILEKVTQTSLLIDFERQELIREETLGEHFMNLRFSVKIIN